MIADCKFWSLRGRPVSIPEAWGISSLCVNLLVWCKRSVGWLRLSNITQWATVPSTNVQKQVTGKDKRLLDFNTWRTIPMAPSHFTQPIYAGLLYWSRPQMPKHSIYVWNSYFVYIVVGCNCSEDANILFYFGNIHVEMVDLYDTQQHFRSLWPVEFIGCCD